MEFEYDEAKSRANEKKHGIDFLQAQRLWNDEGRVEAAARTTDEPRSLVVAMLDGVYWSAVITYRSGRTRIISVRRARPGEIELYEG